MNNNNQNLVIVSNKIPKGNIRRLALSLALKGVNSDFYTAAIEQSSSKRTKGDRKRSPRFPRRF